MIDIFSSEILEDYMRSFHIYHRVSEDDDYGGYQWKWTKGAHFDGIFSEDASLTATVAGIETKTKAYGIKVKKDTPIEFNTVFRDDETKRFFRITTDEPLKSPKISALNMKIFSCEAYEPTDFIEEDDDGDS